MKIYINAINSSKSEAIGYTKMASYQVHFKSLGFEGWARFVPFDENPEAYVHQCLEVEIGYESITGLCVCEYQQQKVVPLAERFSYHVCGEVRTVIQHSEPVGNRTIYVVAGDADFALDFAVIGNLKPIEGDMVEFDIHGLSLWDEML